MKLVVRYEIYHVALKSSNTHTSIFFYRKFPTQNVKKNISKYIAVLVGDVTLYAHVVICVQVDNGYIILVGSQKSIRKDGWILGILKGKSKTCANDSIKHYLQYL